jgi:energy-converting hydrogenase Eha subunit F
MVKCANHENLEEPLERWIEHLNVKIGTAIHESNKERLDMIGKYMNTVLSVPVSSYFVINMFLAF